MSESNLEKIEQFFKNDIKIKKLINLNSQNY